MAQIQLSRDLYYERKFHALTEVESSEFCRHNPLCCFSTSGDYCDYYYSFRYPLSPETFGYTLVYTNKDVQLRRKLR